MPQIAVPMRQKLLVVTMETTLPVLESAVRQMERAAPDRLA
jgi:hypothetical protein